MRRVTSSRRHLGTRARKLHRLSRERSYWPALCQGVAASVEHETVPFAHDYRTVLDVGASRGQFALFAARRFPSARVLCFEPIPASRKRLRSVLGERAEVYDRALGERPGTATLNLSVQDDSSSLLPIGRRQVEEFPGTGLSETLTVSVGTLAEVLTDRLPAPRLLKIDVQGLELQVLRGAQSQIALVDEVYVECSFIELYEGQALADEVVVFLHQHGFRLVGIHNLLQSRDNSALQADFLFRRT